MAALVSPLTMLMATPAPTPTLEWVTEALATTLESVSL